jgi:type IV pilus assembly protein PilC
MAVYRWVGITRKGKTVKGHVEARDERFARAKLGRRNVTVKKITAEPKDLLENVAFLKPRVTKKDIVIFTRQFSTMIDAGLPLVRGLNILAEQNENKTFKKILGEIVRDVEGGSSLADALKNHPAQFDELFVNLVDAGEMGGILDVILQRLAAYTEKAEKLKGRVKGAMTYPIVVLAAALIVISVIMIFVIPVFQDMFADFGSALPLSTQLVVTMSNFTRDNALPMSGGILAFWFLFKKYRNTKRGKRQMDAISLKTPIFGPLIKKLAVARFTRTLSTMLCSGVTILDAMETVAGTSGNKVIEEVILEARSSIAEGRTISEPLADSGIFPRMVVQMIAVGEATGALDAMLEKIADFYDAEVDTAVDALTSMLEPLLMVFLGGAIGGLVIAMYLPIFQMAGAMG